MPLPAPRAALTGVAPGARKPWKGRRGELVRTDEQRQTELELWDGRSGAPEIEEIARAGYYHMQSWQIGHTCKTASYGIQSVRKDGVGDAQENLTIRSRTLYERKTFTIRFWLPVASKYAGEMPSR